MLRTTLMIAALAAAIPTAADSMTSESAFSNTLSNTFPLAFGMTAETAARALGTSLHYVSGRPGEEIFLAIRNIGGSGLFPRDDRLFLQFRRGRLTGFKGDWGRNWMWP